MTCDNRNNNISQAKRRDRDGIGSKGNAAQDVLRHGRMDHQPNQQANHDGQGIRRNFSKDNCIEGGNITAEEDDLRGNRDKNDARLQ